MADLHGEIYDLEVSTWRALQHNGPALIPFLSDDCVMQFPLGLKLTATSEPSVRDIMHSPAFVPWKDFRLDEVVVTPVGTTGAVISYRAAASRAASGVPGDDGQLGDVEFEALCASVWRLENGKWLMCFHQQTMAE